MWETVINILSNYGALGAITLMFLYGNHRRDVQQQESFKMLLDTVLNNHKESILDLKLAIRELIESSKSNKLELQDKINSMKQSCDINCGQILTSLYEEKGVSKAIAYELGHTFLLCSTYQAVVDMDSTIDANGFDTEEALILLNQSIVRIFERRFNELKIRISSIPYKKENVEKVIDALERLSIIYIDSLDKSIVSMTLEKFKEDKNYRKIKINLRNIVFDFSDNATKVLNKFL